MVSPMVVVDNPQHVKCSKSTYVGPSFVALRCTIVRRPGCDGTHTQSQIVFLLRKLRQRYKWEIFQKKGLVYLVRTRSHEWQLLYSDLIYWITVSSRTIVCSNEILNFNVILTRVGGGFCSNSFEFLYLNHVSRCAAFATTAHTYVCWHWRWEMFSELLNVLICRTGCISTLA